MFFSIFSQIDYTQFELYNNLLTTGVSTFFAKQAIDEYLEKNKIPSDLFQKGTKLMLDETNIRAYFMAVTYLKPKVNRKDELMNYAIKNRKLHALCKNSLFTSVKLYLPTNDIYVSDDIKYFESYNSTIY